jgi:hypothetical protein
MHNHNNLQHQQKKLNCAPTNRELTNNNNKKNELICNEK